MLEEIWDGIAGAWEYIIGFEWVSDIGEFFSGMFENIGEFSIVGLVFGLCSFAFIFFLRDYMLSPFLIHMGTGEAIFWGGATYLSAIVGGYLVGKGLFDRD